MKEYRKEEAAPRFAPVCSSKCPCTNAPTRAAAADVVICDAPNYSSQSSVTRQQSRARLCIRRCSSCIPPPPPPLRRGGAARRCSAAVALHGSRRRRRRTISSCSLRSPSFVLLLPHSFIHSFIHLGELKRALVSVSSARRSCRLGRWNVTCEWHK